MEQLLENLFSSLVQFVRDIFDFIFGDWEYDVLFSWLPADIQSAITVFILFLFALALIRVIRDVIP